MFRPKKFWLSKKGPFTRAVGVEIEFLNSTEPLIKALDPVLKRWQAQRGHDGSIRTDGYIQGSGVEVRTAPASGDLFVKQITQICNVLNKHGAVINDSCGLHVHIDARDFKKQELPKVAAIWDSYEKQFLRRVDPKRITNTYCVPWDGDLVSVVKAWKDGCADDSECNCNDCCEGMELDDKYRSFNVSPFLHDWGTWEIRSHQGTLDPKKIIDWATVCSNMVSYAKKTNLGGFARLKDKSLSRFERVI